MQWFFVSGDKARGPIEEEELRRMASAGELQPQQWVWNQAMGDQWAPAQTIPGLFAATPPTATAPAVPGSGALEPGAPVPPFAPAHNRDLMARARASLSGQWGLAVGAVLLYNVLCFASGAVPFLGAIVSLLVAGPLAVGLCLFSLHLARRTSPLIADLFDGFKAFGPALAASILMAIFILLWMLLLIVPGIIAAYSYSQTYFIIAENPTISPLEAIRQSKEMMQGRKWKLFCLMWRFFGWGLLSLLTCCIGFLWLGPYVQTTLAHFYEDVKGARRQA